MYNLLRAGGLGCIEGLFQPRSIQLCLCNLTVEGNFELLVTFSRTCLNCLHRYWSDRNLQWPLLIASLTHSTAPQH